MPKSHYPIISMVYRKRKINALRLPNSILLAYKTPVKCEQIHLSQLVLGCQGLLLKEIKIVFKEKLFLGPS